VRIHKKEKFFLGQHCVFFSCDNILIILPLFQRVALFSQAEFFSVNSGKNLSFLLGDLPLKLSKSVPDLSGCPWDVLFDKL
jgi:hypothetical protein